LHTKLLIWNAPPPAKFSERVLRWSSSMKKSLALTMSAVLLAATSVAGTAEARPKGKAWGHYKQQQAYRYAPPRRSNAGAAIAAGVAGALIGGALTAATQPRVRYYEEPYYRTYSAPRRYYQTCDAYGCY
jgi:hypothetical protein